VKTVLVGVLVASLKFSFLGHMSFDHKNEKWWDESSLMNSWIYSNVI
jgi:hypothetical protein